MGKPWSASVPATGKLRPDIHILPEGDLHPHQEARDCWCVPDLQVVEQTGTVLVLHHAADGRQLIEEHGIQ